MHTHSAEHYYLMDNIDRDMDNLTWRGVTVTVEGRVSKKPKTIVDNVDGIIEADKSA
ncbi:hypothetical protein QQZ08_011774 [Neonectria magnoliae]|uniref:Uncharacterized protein n=1 Tax=Neonectria magnoliae TaxID=2732573 RepID=A0ABR1H8V7_9HYPO